MSGRRLFALAALVAWLGPAGPVPAASLQSFYYLSPVYEVANAPRKRDRPTFSAGYVTLNLDKLPQGEKLAGRTVTLPRTPYDEFDAEEIERRRSPEVVAANFWSGNGSANLFLSPAFDITFGRAGRPKEWQIYEGEWVIQQPHRITTTPRNAYSGDVMWLYYCCEREDTPEYISRQHLLDLGYREGSRAYNRYYNDDLLWRAIYGTRKKGRWFANLETFTAAVEQRALAARRNPPRSYHDIPARGQPAQLAQTPLPPSALLMVAGVAGLAAWKRRAVRAT